MVRSIRVQSPGDAKAPLFATDSSTIPTLSIPYLLILSRQFESVSPYCDKTLRHFLEFCQNEQLPISLYTLSRFSASTGSPRMRNLVRWLAFYGKLSCPPLFSQQAIKQAVYVGEYPLIDLIRFWVWKHHSGKDMDTTYRVCHRTLIHWYQFGQVRQLRGFVNETHIQTYLRYLQQGGLSHLVISQRRLIIQQWVSWLVHQSTDLHFSEINANALRQLATNLSQPDAQSPGFDRYTYYVDIAAPLINHLLNQGVPLAQMSTLLLTQIWFNHADQVYYIVTAEHTYVLTATGASYLERYLKETKRVNYSWMADDQRLFIGDDWPRLWSLTCIYLRGLRIKSRIAKSISTKSPPPKPQIDISTLFSTPMK